MSEIISFIFARTIGAIIQILYAIILTITLNFIIKPLSYISAMTRLNILRAKNSNLWKKIILYAVSFSNIILLLLVIFTIIFLDKIYSGSLVPISATINVIISLAMAGLIVFIFKNYDEIVRRDNIFIKIIISSDVFLLIVLLLIIAAESFFDIDKNRMGQAWYSFFKLGAFVSIINCYYLGFNGFLLSYSLKKNIENTISNEMESIVDDSINISSANKR